MPIMVQPGCRCCEPGNVCANHLRGYAQGGASLADGASFDVDFDFTPEAGDLLVVCISQGNEPFGAIEQYVSITNDSYLFQSNSKSPNDATVAAVKNELYVREATGSETKVTVRHTTFEFPPTAMVLDVAVTVLCLRYLDNDQVPGGDLLELVRTFSPRADLGEVPTDVHNTYGDKMGDTTMSVSGNGFAVAYWGIGHGVIDEPLFVSDGTETGWGALPIVDGGENCKQLVIYKCIADPAQITNLTNPTTTSNQDCHGSSIMFLVESLMDPFSEA